MHPLFLIIVIYNLYNCLLVKLFKQKILLLLKNILLIRKNVQPIYRTTTVNMFLKFYGKNVAALYHMCCGSLAQLHICISCVAFFTAL